MKHKRSKKIIKTKRSKKIVKTKRSKKIVKTKRSKKIVKTKRSKKIVKTKRSKKTRSKKIGHRKFGSFFGSKIEDTPYAFESHVDLGETYENESSFRTALLIIDPQRDFVDEDGSLSVKGAINDMINIIYMIRKFGHRISDIFVTLDTHNRYHIAHSLYWIDRKGNHPNPFTTITDLSPDYDASEWKTTRREFYEDAREYVRSLNVNNRPPLTIWPDHCLLGHEGSAVFKQLEQEFKIWENEHAKSVRYVQKGSDAKTEHYSAFKSEMPIESSKRTLLNEKFASDLCENYDRILICGEALSHCVRYSLEDFLDFVDKSPKKPEVLLITDATTAIPGYEKETKQFLTNISGLVKFCKSSDAFNNITWTSDNVKEHERENWFIDDDPKLWADPSLVNDVVIQNYINDRYKKAVGSKFIPVDFNSSGLPVNRNGSESMYKGRGILGLWGPNLTADTIITRFNNFDNEGHHVIEFLGLIRADNGKISLPGGFRKLQEDVKETAARELIEEITDINDVNEYVYAEILASYKDPIIFDKPISIKNTQNAWIENFVYHLHEPYWLSRILLKPASPEVTDVRWFKYTDDLEMFAGHKEYLDLVVQKLIS